MSRANREQRHNTPEPGRLRSNGIIDIDHVMCKVTDTEEARDAFQRLGFITSPHSSIEDDGVGNRLVVMTPRGDGVANFLELMSIENHARLRPMVASVLDGEPGIKSLVNALDDADAARRDHIEAGIEMLPVWDRARQWRLPSGEELPVRFRVLLPEFGQVPLMFNGVQHLTLQHYLRPEFQRHPNTAQRWAMVTAVIEEKWFEETVGLYEKVYGGIAKTDDDVSILAVRDTRLRLVTADALERIYGEVELSGFRAPGYCAVTIAVGALETAARILVRNGVGHIRSDQRIVIDPVDACGIVLELREAAEEDGGGRV